jgi:hypothetical protein
MIKLWQHFVIEGMNFKSTPLLFSINRLYSLRHRLFPPLVTL